MARRRTSIVLILLVAACAEPPPRPTGVDSKILSEVREAAREPKSTQPQAVRDALMPPLRVEMPAVKGAPIDPRFDLVVSDASAQSVFMSIVSGTRYSMLVHPQVSGNISVNLKDVTIDEALKSIRDLYGYEYRIDGTRIFVEPAGLQTRVFAVNYLLGQRRGSSDVRVQSGSITNASGGGTTTTGTGGSSSSSVQSSRIQTDTAIDFWAELRTALTAIVGTGEGRQIVVTPQSGVVVVRAMPQELRAVAEYLQATRLSVERQVMLEAKILEVTLSEGYQAGINWSLFRNTGPNIAIGQSASGSTLGARPQTLTGGPFLNTDLANRTVTAATAGAFATTPVGAVFGLAIQSSNFSALLGFLESQGNVQVLSSPRIATLNNQKAVLKVGTDEFFVTNVQTTTTTTGASTQQSPSVTVQPFFSGIVLDVTPQIDDGNNIILHVHPSVSEVTESRREVNLGSGTGFSAISLPLAKSSVSETDTIVRVADGQIVAIGGLMSYSSKDNRGGLPGAERAGLGSIFSNTNSNLQKKELVILLKPTLIQNERDWSAIANEANQRLQQLDQGAAAPTRAQ